jgi:hypothetical protein
MIGCCSECLCRAAGRTALHWAATVNNCEVILALLVNGASKDMQDQRDMTPLLLAAREGCRDAVKILLNAGADREIPDDKGRLPRDIALERCHRDLVDFIDRFVPSVASQSDLLYGVPVTSAAVRQQAAAARKPRPKRRSKPSSAEATPRDKKDMAPESVSLPSKITKTKADEFGLGATRAGLDIASIGSLSPVGSFDLPPSYESACAGVSTHAAPTDAACFDGKFFDNDFLVYPSHVGGTELMANGQCAVAGRPSGRSVPSTSVQSPDVPSPFSGGSGNSPLSCGACVSSSGVNTDVYFTQSGSQQQQMLGGHYGGDGLVYGHQSGYLPQPTMSMANTNQTFHNNHLADDSMWMHQQLPKPIYQQGNASNMSSCCVGDYAGTMQMSQSQAALMQQQLQQQHHMAQVRYLPTSLLESLKP